MKDSVSLDIDLVGNEFLVFNRDGKVAFLLYCLVFRQLLEEYRMVGDSIVEEKDAVKQLPILYLPEQVQVLVELGKLYLCFGSK